MTALQRFVCRVLGLERFARAIDGGEADRFVTVAELDHLLDGLYEGLENAGSQLTSSPAR